MVGHPVQRCLVSLRIIDPEHIEMSAELDGFPTEPGPSTVSTVDAALAWVERQLEVSGARSFQVSVTGPHRALEIQSTATRGLAVAFARDSLERALASFGRYAGRAQARSVHRSGA